MQKDSIINIDLSYLHFVTDGDKEFEKTLLASAVTDIQNQVEGLQKAWQQQNAAEVRNAAHSLKSVTAIAGLMQIQNSCKIIDNLFADGVFHADAAGSCNDIINGWEAARPQLEQVINSYQY